MVLLALPSLSWIVPTRGLPFVARRVGRRVHLRFLPAHRLHGNFLSHFVFVFAHCEGSETSALSMSG